MNVYVLVKNFQGVNEGVDLFLAEDGVKPAYEDYTGLSYEDYLKQTEEVVNSDDYSETRVFETDLFN